MGAGSSYAAGQPSSRRRPRINLSRCFGCGSSAGNVGLELRLRLHLLPRSQSESSGTTPASSPAGGASIRRATGEFFSEGNSCCTSMVALGNSGSCSPSWGMGARYGECFKGIRGWRQGRRSAMRKRFSGTAVDKEAQERIRSSVVTRYFT
jgi:hypothetical protein